MADIRDLYITVLKDYDYYAFFEDKEEITHNLDLDSMLYNLCCIVQLNFSECTKEELKNDSIYQRMWTLIELLTILGGKATLH